MYLLLKKLKPHRCQRSPLPLESNLKLQRKMFNSATRFVNTALALLLSTSMIACSGSEGPTGPQGPAGPPGKPQLLSGTIPSGGGLVVFLPPEAGNQASAPPALTCYISQSPHDVWLVVADGAADANSIRCGLTFSNGRFSAVIINAPVGWTAMFVVSY